MNKHFLLVFIIYYVSVFSLWASESDPVLVSPIEGINAEIQVRLANEEKIEAYRSQQAFQYEENIPVDMGVKQNVLFWLLSKILEFLTTPDGTVKVIRYIFFVFLITILLFKIFNSKVQGLFYANRTAANVPFSEKVKDINRIDLDGMFLKEKEKGNYILAIRYLYLKLLKVLENKQLILWAVDKTNHDYLKEMTGTPFHSHMCDLTNLFEYTWYGKFTINRLQFDSIHQRFSSFFDKIINNAE